MRFKVHFSSLRRVTGAGLAALASAWPLQGQTQDLSSAEGLAAHLEEFASGYLQEKHRAGIVLAVTRQGEQTVRAAGVRSRKEPNLKLRENDLFEIGSITKALTGVLLAASTGAGEISLDQEVSSLLPEGAKVPRIEGRSMTLLDLATHRSGLPRLPFNLMASAPLRSNPYGNYEATDLLPALAHEKDEAKADYDYSNFGFMLLGDLLERAAGKSYAELLETRLCGPLGMNDTFVEVDDAVAARLVKGHADGKVVAHWTNGPLPGAGAIVSTAGDLLTLLEAHWEDASPAMKAALDLAASPHFQLPGKRMAMGLGWHIVLRGDEPSIYWHNGGTGGFHSYCAFIREAKVGVVVLANSADNAPDEIGAGLLRALTRTEDES